MTYVPQRHAVPSACGKPEECCIPGTDRWFLETEPQSSEQHAENSLSSPLALECLRKSWPGRDPPASSLVSTRITSGSHHTQFSLVFS